MISRKELSESVGKLNHIEVSAFLRKMGWQEVEIRKNAAIFQFSRDGRLWQANVPTRRGLRDYTSAMFEIVENLAEIYDKNEEQVLLELQYPVSDVVRIRLAGSDMRYGSISIEETLSLYQNTRLLVMASAMDMLSPRRHFTNSTDEVRKFLNSCRFGQTEVGSYVISLICPMMQNTGRQFTLFDNSFNEGSLTRRIMNKMITGADQVKRAINAGDLEALVYRDDKESQDGVSINFLKALQGLGIHREEHSVDLEVQWCPTVTENRASVQKVTLNHDYLAPINSVVTKWKSQVQNTKSYCGRIKGTSSEPNVDKRIDGVIKIVYFDENGQQGVADVRLGKSDYDRAMEAHRLGKFVFVKGKLTGQNKKKIDCQEFTVLKDNTVTPDMEFEYGLI